MTGEVLGFWAVAVVLLASSLGVVLTRNLFHAVLYLTAVLVATAVVFLLLDSPFLFAVQLLLYAGGVVTIVVFAIMLTERLVGETLTQTNRYVVNGAIVSAAVFVAIAGFLLQADAVPASPGLARRHHRGARSGAARPLRASASFCSRSSWWPPSSGPSTSPAPTTRPMPLHAYLALAGLVFAIGLFGVLTRRNAIGILLGIELMLNAVIINLVAFSRFHGDLTGRGLRALHHRHHRGRGRGRARHRHHDLPRSPYRRGRSPRPSARLIGQVNTLTCGLTGARGERRCPTFSKAAAVPPQSPR